jgi:hypothetical protein
MSRSVSESGVENGNECVNVNGCNAVSYDDHGHVVVVNGLQNAIGPDGRRNLPTQIKLRNLLG